MGKKGLSPLIATVLLIGITISLATLVMVWGQALFKQTTEDTGEFAQGEITCTSRVQVDIISTPCVGVSGTINAVVDNKNEEPISGLIVRLYGDNNQVQTINMPLSTPLDAFNTQVIGADPGGVTGGIYKIEVIPQITLDNGKLKTCGQRLSSYGDLAGSPLAACP